MIHKVLNIVKKELDGKITDASANAAEIVIGDIAKGDNDATSISDKIVITLLNVEEEKTLKNNPRYERVIVPGNGDSVPDHKGYVEKSPPAYLNLYVMISANRSTYANSLVDISQVIEIFQAKKVLTSGSTVPPEEEFKFKIQLHSLPFDQLSYAWGLLGGKVMPSALYKISIVKIQGATVIPNPELISEIDITKIKNTSIKETLPLI